MSNHQSSYSAIAYKLKQFGVSNLTILPKVFKFVIQKLKAKCSVKFGPIMAHKNTLVISHDMKETNCSKRVFYE